MKPAFGVVVQPGTTRRETKTGWRIYRPRHKQVDCIGCRNCELMCPDGAVYRIDKRKFDADMDACKGCGVCAVMCPVDDIDMVLESECGEKDRLPGPEVPGESVEHPDEEYGIDMVKRDQVPPEGNGGRGGDRQ